MISPSSHEFGRRIACPESIPVFPIAYFYVKTTNNSLRVRENQWQVNREFLDSILAYG